MAPLTPQKLRELVWAIRFNTKFALDGLVDSEKNKTKEADAIGAGREAEVYPQLARVMRVVLREHELSARESVRLLVPPDSHDLNHPLPVTAPATRDEVARLQAEFVQRLCLTVKYASEGSDPTAALAVAAVRRFDEQQKKVTLARQRAIDAGDVDAQAEAEKQEKRLADELASNELLDDKKIPPLVFEKLEGVRPDLHEGRASTRPTNRKFQIFASAPMSRAVLLAFRASAGKFVCGFRTR